MYRSSAQIPSSHVVTATISSPAKMRDDTEQDHHHMLEQKRQQIEEEIAQFRTAKEREFKEFEGSLKKQRPKRKRAAVSSELSQDDSKAGALSLLAMPDKPTSTHALEPTQSIDCESESSRASKSAPSCKPILSVEALNIRGETTPPSTYSNTPPSPTAVIRRLSRSPKDKSVQRKPPLKPMTPPTPTEPPDNFAGVFTPAYLPLLESKAPPNVSTRDFQPDAKTSTSLSLSISPISRSQRSQTEPSLPSNSLPTGLPSALRTASGTGLRRRKRVTFQLADSAIVEPSSSYEEMPSPELREEGEIIDGILSYGAGVPEQENGGEDEGDDESSYTPWQRHISSPVLRGRDRQSSDDTVIPDGPSETEDGGSGVGFFELDEELASPGAGELKPFLQEEMRDLNLEDEDPRGKEEERLQMTYEYSGSVPIDIVRPTGSWVGSFGH